MHHQYWNITKVERYNKASISRINGGRDATKKLKDVFHQGSLSLSLFKWNVAYSSIFVFSKSKCTAFFCQPNSIWLFSWELAISNPSYHAPRILEHNMSWEVQTLLSRINGGKNVTKKLKYVFYQGSLLLSLFKWDVAYSSIFVFSASKCTVFLVSQSLYDSTVEK